MTTKKFNYKVPSIAALTLAGTALTTHHAQAADDIQDQSKNKNVLDDEHTLKQSQDIKSEVSKPTTNISGTQAYKDPSQVQLSNQESNSNYDAHLDELNSETSDQTSNDDTYNEENQNTEENTGTTQDTEQSQVEDDGNHSETSQQQDSDDVAVADTSDSDAGSIQDTEQSQVEDNGNHSETSQQQDSDDVAVADTSDSDAGSIQDTEQSQVEDNGNHSETSQQQDSDDVAVADTSDSDAENTQDTEQSQVEDNGNHSETSQQQDSDDVAVADTSDSDAESTQDTEQSQVEDNGKKDAQTTSTTQDSTVTKRDDVSQQDQQSENVKDTASQDVAEDTKEDEKSQDDIDTNDDAEAKSDDVSQQDQQSKDAKDTDSQDVAEDTKKDENSQDDIDTNDDAEAKSDDISQQDQQSKDVKDTASNSDAAHTQDDSNQTQKDTASQDVAEDTKEEENSQDDIDTNDDAEAKSDDVSQQDQQSKDAKDTASNSDAAHAQDDSNQTQKDTDSQDVVEDTKEEENSQDDIDTNDDAEAKSDDVSQQDQQSVAEKEDATVTTKEQNDTDDSTPKTAALASNTYSAQSAPKLRTATYSANNTNMQRSTAVKEATTTNTLAKYTPKVNSSINNYIRKNNFKAPNYEEDIASYLPKYNYRYGAPEGIVLHDTANDNSTITGEINYMKNNYNSAFVHAYVDGNRIIETADTDYLAWGAGPAANDRFIHVELVHTHDYESFARSINNYADYAATNLNYYGLAPNSAEYDGAGTVWTHQAVSNYLGGSDHSDPHGYLAAHNYSYDELYDLIYEKYLIKTGQAAAWGDTTTTPPKTGTVSVKSNNGVARINSKNDGLYTTVYDQNGKKTDKTNQTLKVTKSASLDNENFYLVSDYNKGNLIGWVHKDDVAYNTAKSVAKIDKTYKIKSGETLYSVPWGTSAQKVGTVSGKSTQTFKATKQQQIGKTNYIYGTVNKLSGWVSLSKLEGSNTTPSTDTDKLTVTNLTNQQGTVAQSNHGVYTSVYDKQGVQKSYVNGKTYKLSKKASLGTNDFYLITDNKTNTNLGWMQSGDIKVKAPAADKLTVTNLTNQQGTVAQSNHGVYTSVYDKQGVQKSYVNGKTYKLSKKASLGTNDFYLITDNKTNTNLGWMQSGDIKVKETATLAPTNKTVSVSKVGQLSNTNSGVKATVYDEKGKDASKLSGRTYTVTKQRTQGDNTYVLIQNTHKNTPIGWVNTKDINTRNLSKTTAKNGQYTIKATNNGLYAVPWGTKAQQLDSLKNTRNSKFNASKSVFVDKDEYLYGIVNNKTGWISAKDLNTLQEVNGTQSNQTANATNTSVTPEKFDYVIYNADGSYYTNPNSSEAAGSLTDFYEGIFSVYEKQVINGVTWYHGKLENGEVVWIKESDLIAELVKYYESGLTLDEAAALQKGLPTKPQIQHTPGKWEDANATEIKNAMDSNKLANDPTQKYQFLRLDKSQNISADDLNKLLVGKGILEGQGEAFSEAAKTNNINEVYLISHALLETGNGTSTLANGGDVINDEVVTDKQTKYYNMFGIGAVDRDPIKQGFITAKNNGWDSVKKAIIGGAGFIADSYINKGQNTLYKMRWNPENPGVHQYATDVAWASHNATRIKNFYDSMGKLGKYFDINTYKM
ncbi:GW dipeptide domain-containing protein [Staphylococcus succinus]|uniref:GW dipeptide domain-containing protein n=1 Tax=Staphylococcus succinus TaxID=61015 RepID=UPI000E68693E|nr:GW dipeptide domain-containing protein [Staphylococcus succinus]RIN35680.1 autolysin [Staphylococcus succinus]